MTFSLNRRHHTVRGALLALLALLATVLTPVGVASAAAPVLTAPPTISGTARVLSVLTCSTGGWDQPVTLSYAWTNDDVAISGAAAATYTVRSADVGHHVACQVTASTHEPAATTSASAWVIPQRALQTIGGALQTSAGAARACGASLGKACTESRGANGTVRFGGTLAPARPGTKVVVILERQRDKAWVISMSRTATVLAGGSYSVSIPARFFASANWRIRTRVPETDVYDLAQSPLRFLRVTR